MQKIIVKLMSTIRDLRYNIDKGIHSKLEMNVRKVTDLTYVLAELDVSLAEQQTGSFFPFKC